MRESQDDREEADAGNVEVKRAIIEFQPLLALAIVWAWCSPGRLSAIPFVGGKMCHVYPKAWGVSYGTTRVLITDGQQWKILSSRSP